MFYLLLFFHFVVFAQSLVLKMTGSGLEITGRGITVTEALRSKVTSKIGGTLSKFGQDCISSQVVLKVEPASTKNAETVEVTLNMKGGTVVRCELRGDDMYTSIDKVSNILCQKLLKHKSKVRGQESGMGVRAVPLADSPVQSDIDRETQLLEKQYKDNLGDDPSEWSDNFSTIVKKKTFPMPAISVDEALMYLNLIDHPFYVFRNKETLEINVVYKRRVGEGAGLIQPEI